MRKIIISFLLFFSVNALATDTYEQTSKVLTLDSIIINGTQFNNLVVQLTGYNVINPGTKELVKPACDLSSLKGTYAVTFQGNVLSSSTPPVVIAQIAMAGLTTYDGLGNFSNKVKLNQNGVTNDIDVSGTYTMNADCTGGGQMTLPGQPPMSFGAVIGERFADGKIKDFSMVSTTPGMVGIGTGKIQ